MNGISINIATGEQTEFIAVPAPTTEFKPAVVSMRQARLALLQAGLLAQVNSTISTMTGVEGDAARIEWEYAAEVQRDSPLVASLTVALGMTETQLDSLFLTAYSL